MSDIQYFDDAQAIRLGAFLSALQRPEGTMSYCECAGFLFTVACAPELIKPSEWMGIIFNEEDALYESMEEAQEVLQSLMALYNEMNRQVREADVHLPPWCHTRWNPMDNLEADAPLSQWSKGFTAGYDGHQLTRSAPRWVRLIGGHCAFEMSTETASEFHGGDH